MPVPTYLGRVSSGTAAGTCFQVAPGILVTAQHVLDGDVLVEPLAGGPAAPASVLREDPAHDLAVLRIDESFPSSVALSATDASDLTTPVVVTGVSEVEDEHLYRHLDAVGVWAGGTTRDGIPLGRLSSKDVVPGMSGGPVRRIDDDAVIGIVSGRYNSADGWLRDSVWVARIEDLQPLLADLADVSVAGRPLGPAIDLLLGISEPTVRLYGPGVDITDEHLGVSLGLRRAYGDMHRAGQHLAESFLPNPVRDALAEILRRAEAEDAVVRIGVDAPGFAALPWEALQLDDRPLALRRSIVVYRKSAASPPRPIPGPLRIVVAIASPEDGGPVLDYERELRNVLASVRGARAGDAQVRVVPFATTRAIRDELTSGPAHVLHLSGYGKPGVLLLEHEDGSAREVTAETFVNEAIPPGAMPPVVALSSSHTHVPPLFSAGLMQFGTSVVIGTEMSVSDRYGTRFFARVYNELATASTPDVVAAVAEARRLVRIELSSMDDDRDDWSKITVHAAGGTAPLFNPAESEKLPPPNRQSLRGLLDRGVGEFVGRRREQRELPALLLGTTTSGIVLHGIGGVGKTTLAAQLVRRIQGLDPGRRAVVLTGKLSIDSIFTKVATVLRRNNLRDVAEFIGHVDERWQDRLEGLREDALDNVPLLIVLDNFEDNLTDGEISDTALAGLLKGWSTDPGVSRLLVTSRYRFALPHMTFRSVGPMSLAETAKLIWSLPALDELDPPDLERVWRMVGGHPRTLEYLDALLAGGQARFRDVTERLVAALGQAAFDSAPTLDAALAQSITLATNDILLNELLATLPPAAEQRLLELSVFREPIDVAEDLTPIVATSLAALDNEDKAFVHRWTAAELARLWSEGRSDDLRMAHRKAARYWTGRYDTERLDHPADFEQQLANREADIHQLLEARHHLLAADDREEAGALTETVWSLLHEIRALDRESELIHESLRWVDPNSTRYALFLLLLGNVAQERGENPEAHRCYNAALRLSSLLDDQAGTAKAYHQLGMLAVDQREYDTANGFYRQSLEIEAKLGNRNAVAATYHELGWLAHRQGAYAEAEDHYRQSLKINEQLDNQAEMAGNYIGLGGLAQFQGQYDQAMDFYLKSLEIFDRLNDQVRMATTLHNLGAIAMVQSAFAPAMEFHLSAFAIRIILDLPEAAESAAELRTIRELLGEPEFNEMAGVIIGSNEVAELNDNLDSFADESQSLGEWLDSFGRLDE